MLLGFGAIGGMMRRKKAAKNGRFEKPVAFEGMS
jgi:hypothetical protein